MSTNFGWEGKGRYGRWFISLADERGVCRWNCEIPWERVPYQSALEVCSRRGAIQIHVYLYLYTKTDNISGTMENQITSRKCSSYSRLHPNPKCQNLLCTVHIYIKVLYATTPGQCSICWGLTPHWRLQSLDWGGIGFDPPQKGQKSKFVIKLL